ncbi:S9 family peptidase [Dyadobacter sp. CY347]|uniref:alpha/beta hydrolase family protein n=1 Tax=Dyadobacter sp. CY347 TaxID=2909336 RepID=UPI001F3B6591|nr:alpha/beta hydrolase [Dyadobacter sp. CY347]MCF2490736.1 alpha/beta fold hydrolase [Dyadobacter sp. CY347]
MKTKSIILVILVVTAAVLVYFGLRTNPVVTKAQEPTLPYPYQSEDVTFANNKAGIKLSGTFTYPKKEGAFPVVILISGSGPQDRNEEVFGHKPFLVIADHLTRQGIAVLRYDDRGIGKSTGNFMMATTLDYATDAESAVAYLKTRKEIDSQKIGLAGHSEGGLVAAIAASRTKDIGFVISLAGPGVKGIEVIKLQSELIARAGGIEENEIAMMKKMDEETIEILLSTPDTTLLRTKMAAHAKRNLKNFPEKVLPPGQSKEQFFASQINAMCTPWYQFLYKSDPAAYFSKITCPILALNGAKDLQVSASQNLPAILKAASDGNNKNVTIKELADLNHFFQSCKTGHPNEYAGLPETFSPVALAAISDWITTQIKLSNK